MFAMTRSTVTALACMGIYKLPPPGPVPLPGPLPSSGSYTMVVDICPQVTLAGMPACVIPATIPMSTGDEASASGSAGGGGVVSFRFKAECVALQPSMKVFFGGKGAVSMTSATAHDAYNTTTGSILGPAQCKVAIG